MTSTAAQPTSPVSTPSREPIASPYGTWVSPIRVEDLLTDTVNLAAPRFVGDEVWWLEGRPVEGGRNVVVAQATDGTRRDLLPAPWNARSRVHEYGGLAYVAVPAESGSSELGASVAHDVVFAEWSDQRLYRTEASGRGTPIPLTPEAYEPAGTRYADLRVATLNGRTVVLAVRETHRDGDLTRAIVAVPADGSGAAPDAGTIRVLADNCHFLANPRISPDGRQLAWLGWDHPFMPWDGTYLFVAALLPDGGVGEPRVVLGGVDESVTQAEWVGDDRLYAVSDRSGWWNLYEVLAATGEPRALCTRNEEFGAALWVLGLRTFALLDDGRVLVLHGVGRKRLGLLDPANGDLHDLDLPYADWTPDLDVSNGAAVGVALSERASAAVVRVDLATGDSVRLREAISSLPDPAYLPEPRTEVFEGVGGRPVYANVYPPHNRDFVGPDGELPPYVAFVHGGPTSASSATLNLGAAILTSRGIGVIDVNYGGSVGFGRAYRQSLLREWGVVDVEDTVSAATGLAARGDADPERLAIRGGSAGGWTTLCALTRESAFACGTSLFGVADLEKLVETTHDFESRYVERLVGELPADHDIFVERSPLTHADEMSVPVLLLQGLEDEIVPPSQAEVFVEALQAAGVPFAYLAFEGEQHGFRRAENIITATNAELSFYGQVFGFEPPGIPVLEMHTPSYPIDDEPEE